MRFRAPLAALAGATLLAAVPLPEGGATLPAALTAPLPDPDGAITSAVRDATEGLSWLLMDMHLHTDHSSDAGFFHQQEDTPESHDTFLDEQRDQAIRMGMDAVGFTDHRTFDQHYDPEYATGDAILVTAEEWGGSRHGTAFGMVEVLEHDGSPEACGMAQASLEAAAQDALLGIAHPKDDRCLPQFGTDDVWPISHVEALRGGDNELQDAGFPGGGNGSNSAWYGDAVAAGFRLAAVNGSDNHFKQVWPGPSGPGGSSAHLLVRDHSQAGIVEAIRERRTVAGWGVASPRVTTLLDADRDGTFDAVTGGHAVPEGETVTVAFRVEQGQTHWLQVFDSSNAVVAESIIALPDQTLAFELPASGGSYRAQIAVTQLSQVGLPDPFDYADTLVAVSTPVWLSAPANAAEAPSGPLLTRQGSGAWSGFPAVAQSGDAIHVVWQERRDTEYVVAHRRSLDRGATWSATRVLGATGDDRLPTVSIDGERVTVAWERHDPGRLGGDLVVSTSADGGASFANPVTLVAGNASRPALASADGVDHLVWQQQSGDGPWSIHYARRVDGVWGDPIGLTVVTPWNGAQATYAVPPRTIRHVPAAVNPAIAVRGDRVVVAWEDNREDPTPLRSGTPDDWAIFAASSTDGGSTFGPDTRVSPKHLAKDEPTPEGVEGNPARNVDVALLADGTALVAYQDPFPTGRANVVLQRSPDLTTWEAPVAIAPAGSTRAYRPELAVTDGVVVAVWQQSDGPFWRLDAAASFDGGRSFSAPERVTRSGRFAGWADLNGEALALVAETADGFHVHTAELLPRAE